MTHLWKTLCMGAVSSAMLCGCQQAVNQASETAVDTASEMMAQVAQTDELVLGLAGGFAIDPVREAPDDGRYIASQDVKLLPASMPEVLVKSDAAKPNIIYILVDDFGRGDVSYLGSEIQTPHLDQMTRDGVELDRFYSTPICTPTRTALLTGRSSLEFGATGPLDDRWVVAPNHILLPSYFQAAGYDTWMIGKWHMGLRETNALPNARGFDYFYGFLGGFIDFYTKVYWDAYDWQRNGETVREEGYVTHLLIDDAIRMIEQHDEDPFFMYLALNSPHTPLQYPPNATSAYDDMENKSRAVYAQMVTDLDLSVGRLRAAIDAAGLTDETLIVFTSDNGGAARLGSDNGDLREGKGSVYEGGVRVPGIAVWPGTLPAGFTSDYPVFVQNWAPTLLDAAGIEASGDPFAGVSAWPALMGDKTATLPGETLVGAVIGTSVFDWPYKYIVETPRGASEAKRELYNVVDDPLEQNELSVSHPDIAARLAAIIDNFDAPESLAETSLPPERLYRGPDGNVDFGVRLREARPPVADTIGQTDW